MTLYRPLEQIFDILSDVGTDHIFVIWSCIRIKGEVSREKLVLAPLPQVVFLLTIPKPFLCCSSSLFVCLDFMCSICFVIIGIKHGLSCINIRQVPRDLANVNALKNHVRSLLLQ